MSKKVLSVILFFLIVGATNAQDYKKVQVTTREGMTIKGKNGILTKESISFLTGSGQRTYPISDVNLIQAKEGKAGKWALYSGGGCLGIGLIVSLTQGGKYNETSGETYDTGTLLAGSVIWAGIFAGAGAIVGSLVDNWEIVYNRNTSAVLKNFRFDLGTNQYAGLNFRLSRKF
jgi:hypothetical protein